jgi:ribose transport system ATP-binding protein
MTVAENIAQYAGYAIGGFGIDWQRTRRLALGALAKLEVDLDPDALVGELSIAEQSVVAIARALALDARLIVLDEPTASLAAGEARRLLAILNRLREAGLSCILVTHRIDEVLANCDRVTVLRNGLLAGTCPVAELTREALIEMIVGGSPLKATRGPRVDGERDRRLEVRGMRGPGFGPIDLDVCGGEVLAVTGLADAGHLALVDAIFGVLPVHEGEIRIDGEAYRPSGPSRALARGVRQVPSDRNALGLAASLTARENLFANPGDPELRPMSRRVEREHAAALLEEFDVRPRNTEAPLAMFSGGNAQKILVARSLIANPRLLLLSEPTAGVDIGARAAIYAKLRDACSRGLAIVMATSDFEEVEDLADRAAVLFRGSMVAMLDADEISVAALTTASYGA